MEHRPCPRIHQSQAQMETKCSAFRAILCLTTSTLHILPGFFWCWDGLVSVLENPNQSLDKTHFYSGRNVPALAAQAGHQDNARLIQSLRSDLEARHRLGCVEFVLRQFGDLENLWETNEFESPFLSSFCLLCIDVMVGPGASYMSVFPTRICCRKHGKWFETPVIT